MSIWKKGQKLKCLFLDSNCKLWTLERVRIFVGRDRRLRGVKLLLCSLFGFQQHKLYPCSDRFQSLFFFLSQEILQPSCLRYQCYNKFIVLLIDKNMVLWISLLYENVKSIHVLIRIIKIQKV